MSDRLSLSLGQELTATSDQPLRLPSCRSANITHYWAGAAYETAVRRYPARRYAGLDERQGESAECLSGILGAVFHHRWGSGEMTEESDT
jgi:hypothetical protein